MIVASAPGKLVLSGEYAVLDGAPAIAMAVNRRARVSISSANESAIECIGLGGASDSALYDCVLHAAGDIDPQPAKRVLDTSAFCDAPSGAKFGIGSSAALTVALARALMPDAATATVQDVAARAHREFQGGSGSGVDIATSVAGGLVDFTMGQAGSALHWPQGLHYALLWSGVAASTKDHIDRLAYAGTHPSRGKLHAAAIATAAAWRAASAQDVVAASQAYAAQLAEFDVDHALGIFEAGHQALAQAAAQSAVAYKPCGAGGGDVGIVLATSQAAVDDFVGKAEASGFLALDIRLDNDGMRIDA